MKLDKAVSVEYCKDSKCVVVLFSDGSRTSWPVRLLEMTERTEAGYVQINPTDEQLTDVELFGGDYILWDELDQIFRIEDLQNRIYGRKVWMTLIANAISSST